MKIDLDKEILKILAFVLIFDALLFIAWITKLLIKAVLL